MPASNFRLVGAALIASSAIGYLIGKKYYKSNHLKPNTILDNVRHQFSHDAVIRDAWIDKQKQPYAMQNATTSVYCGGFTRIEDTCLVPYKFAVDATSGTIIDLKRITFN